MEKEKKSEIENLAEDHDLYLKSDILLFTDIFKNFRKICLNICHFDPVKLI